VVLTHGFRLVAHHGFTLMVGQDID